jgi:hypothetical protein
MPQKQIGPAVGSNGTTRGDAAKNLDKQAAVIAQATLYPSFPACGDSALHWHVGYGP